MTHTTPSLNRRQVLAAAAGGAAVVGAPHPHIVPGHALDGGGAPGAALSLIHQHSLIKSRCACDTAMETP